VPTVEGMLADAGAARRAGADVVIVSVHCCTEYQTDPPPAQLKIAAALLASPDVDLVIGHHAHVVQPLERINGKWVAYGLGNHVAEQTTQATNDSVITRFTFTRGTDNHFTVTAAEAIPTRIQHTNHGVVVVPTKPGDASYRRVAQVLERRGAVNAGLVIVGQ
jgi:poly-gamma-glutamate synthesis protein (capsule biosynthesis protein)